MLKPATNMMMSYQNSPVSDEADTDDVLLVTTILPPITTTTMSYRLKWMGMVVAVVAGIMLLVGGTVWVQDGSYTHATGSIETVAKDLVVAKYDGRAPCPPATDTFGGISVHSFWRQTVCSLWNLLPIRALWQILLVQVVLQKECRWCSGQGPLYSMSPEAEAWSVASRWSQIHQSGARRWVLCVRAYCDGANTVTEEQNERTKHVHSSQTFSFLVNNNNTTVILASFFCFSRV